MLRFVPMILASMSLLAAQTPAVIPDHDKAPKQIDRPIVPIDPNEYKRLAGVVIQAMRDGDDHAVLIEGRRALEVIPNNPELQGPVYLSMSKAAGNLGENERAEEYLALSKILDPALESRTRETASGLPVRGGNTANNIMSAVSGLTQAMGAIQQMRLMKLCLDMVKHNMTPPPQCNAQAGAPSLASGNQLPQPGGVPQPPVQFQVNPQVQVNQAGLYQPQPQQPVYQPQVPQPVYQPPLAADAQQLQVQPQQPVYQLQYPQAQPQQQPIVYPTAAVGAPGYQVQSMPPAAMPGWQPQAPVSQITLQMNTQQQYLRPPVSAPYGNPGFAPLPGRTRGGEEPVFKVVHDHSTIGSANYFDESCGGLLSVDGTNLTFTASGGEQPRIIPASEIVEIRLNSIVGRDAGFFHIATKQGLYLSLAPDSWNREQARSIIETIRAKLGVVE